MYTCPMHPEVTHDGPGHCPKCGMALVPVEDNTQPKPKIIHANDRGLGQITWRSYLPLIVIFSLLFLVALLSTWNDYREGYASFHNFIMYFMSGFFIVFAGFKLMDLKGFAEGYSTYDLVAMKYSRYGFVYPFIELWFGFSMLLGNDKPLLLWIEIIVMVVSGIGVARKLARREEFTCACLGTFLKVPLTYVTLIEDFGMALLALLLLFLK
jgi:hypothetical protein